MKPDDQNKIQFPPSVRPWLESRNFFFFSRESWLNSEHKNQRNWFEFGVVFHGDKSMPSRRRLRWTYWQIVDIFPPLSLFFYCDYIFFHQPRTKGICSDFFHHHFDDWGIMHGLIQSRVALIDKNNIKISEIFYLCVMNHKLRECTEITAHLLRISLTKFLCSTTV